MFVSDGSATSETAVIPDWKRASKKLPFDKCAPARHVLLVRKQTCICHSVSQKQLLCLCLKDFPTWPPPKPSKSSVTYARWPTSAERTAHSAGEPTTVSAKVLSQRHLNKSDLIYGWGWAQRITLRDVTVYQTMNQNHSRCSTADSCEVLFAVCFSSATSLTSHGVDPLHYLDDDLLLLPRLSAE